MRVLCDRPAPTGAGVNPRAASDPVGPLDGTEAGRPGSDSGLQAAWAASGAMALTGRSEGPPLVPPVPTLRRIAGLGRLLAGYSAQLGCDLRIDPFMRLGERAALAGLSRRGDKSCGGSTRLLRARDNWIAVTLARPRDWEYLPAWLELDTRSADGWEQVGRAVEKRRADDLVERSAWLGLAVTKCGETAPSPSLLGRAHQTAAENEQRRPDDLVVVNLASLWAGPLAASVLQEIGARVINVESLERPDGSRQEGPNSFYDLLHHGQESVALEFGTSAGRDALKAILAAGDIIIEGSRPRALVQLGVDPVALMMAERGPRIWISITGHGRSGAGGLRIGFGDDAAAAGGLLAWDQHGPCFCADAIADPITGLAGAAAVLKALASGGRWLLDVGLAPTAAAVAGDLRLSRSRSVPGGVDGVIERPSGPVPIGAPTVRAHLGRAPRLGEHTESVLRHLRMNGRL